MTRSPVLVTDGEQRSALAVVRSLGAAGYPVYVCATRRGSLAGASNQARGEAQVADALADPHTFRADVQALVSRWHIGAMLPITDGALLAVLGAPEQFANVRIPFPGAEVFRRVSDKALVLDAARELGIAVPMERRVNSHAEAVRASAAMSFPLVLKPSRSVRESSGGLTKLDVQHARDVAELEVRLARLGEAAYPLLLQERIIGDGVGVFLLRRDDRVAAVFAHRRIREKPPAGGVSVYCESIPADPLLVSRSEALLRRLGWHGIAMIEYKRDATTGTAYLMEINGRFWGSLQLAIDAGVDFPAMLLADAEDREPAAPTYGVAVRSRWWWGDVDHLLTRLRRSAAELNLPPGAPGRLQVLRDFLAAGPPWRDSDVLRLGDLRPFVRETVDWFRGR